MLNKVTPTVACLMIVSLFSSHPVWFRLSFRGFIPACSSLCSAQQRHRDQTGCQEICHGATQAGRRTC